MTPSELLPQVYDELRELAARRMAAERPGHTLDPTGLVHEAWLKLAHTAGWQDRSHFFRTAAAAMRQVLIDHARARLAEKRGGGTVHVELPDPAAPMPDDRLVALDDALTKLALSRPEHAQLVELRFFGGLTREETAAALGVSPATVDRRWRFARAWLQLEIQ